jgi:hypothetical protein
MELSTSIARGDVSKRGLAILLSTLAVFFSASTTTFSQIQFGVNRRHILTRHSRNDKVVGSLSSLVADVSRGGNIAIPASSRPPTCSTPGQINCLRASDVGQWDALFAGTTGMIDSVSILTVRDGSLKALPFGTPMTTNTTLNAYEFYFQDSWQLKPSFAVTLGLSYGWQRPPQDKLRRQTRMVNMETGRPLTYENYIEPRREAALRGEIFNPQIGFQPVSSSGGDLFKTDWNNFAPRLAAAWNPSFNGGVLHKLFGDRKTVLRGGFGVSYDRINTSESVILPAKISARLSGFKNLLRYTDNSTRQRYYDGHGGRLMVANIEEKVIEKLRVLPEHQQAEVLKFVEDLAELEKKADNGNPGGRVAIWDKIEEIMRDVPDEVLASIRGGKT